MLLKTKILLIKIAVAILIIAGVVFTIVIQRNLINKYKSQYENAAFNFKNANFRLDSVRTKYGLLVYSTNQLNVLYVEAKSLNSKMVQTIKEMELKLKNVQSVTIVEYKYVFKTDTIYVEKILENDSIQRFYAWYKDKFISVGEYLTYDKCDRGIIIDSLDVVSVGEIVTVFENIYERKFLCKKVVGVKVHVTSPGNPYFYVNKIETYRFRKNDKELKTK